jgi:hypothetical protein
VVTFDLVNNSLYRVRRFVGNCRFRDEFDEDIGCCWEGGKSVEYAEVFERCDGVLQSVPSSFSETVVEVEGRSRRDIFDAIAEGCRRRREDTC